ncbi:putative bifunctional diguanylate cyclase/phosphodiesterase [Marinomonas epiphytica]
MLINLLKNYFNVQQNYKHGQDNTAFRQSALRVFLALSLVIFLGVEAFYLAESLQSNEYISLIIMSLAVLFLCKLIYFSNKYVTAVAFCFVAFLAFTGFVLLAVTENYYAQKYALISLYSIPLVVRLLFSFKASLIAICLNVIPFYAFSFNVFNNVEQSDTSLYFQLLTFFTLNIALPVAVSRIINTLEENTSHINLLYKKLNKNHALYQEFFEHTGSPSVLCNQQGTILKANHSALRLLTNKKRKTVENTKILNWLVPVKSASEKYFWQSNATECTLKSDPNTHIEVHRATLTKHGYYVLHLQVVTHLKQMQEKLEHQQQTSTRLAHFDTLTKLPNHYFFCQMVNKKLTNDNHTTGAMVIIRISQFKLFNKQYGKDNANKIIYSFAKKLQKNLDQDACIARLRGVKFACFVPLNQTYLIQKNFAEFINSILPAQVKINGHILNINYNVGISYYRNNGETAEELVEQCEMALEHSTSADNYSFFDKEVEQNLILEHQLGLKLSSAIKRNELSIWLQPQVNRYGEIGSFEALARWQQKDGSFVSPVVFIKVAEDLGLLPLLAESMIKQLVGVLSEWHKEGIRTPIAFNLAGPELMNDMFFALLMSLISDHPWLHEMLELEITETSPVMTHPLIHKRLRVLSQYGFSIAIDDFGTGQASLGQLVDIAANILKIDRRFVMPLPEDKRHLDIVKSTLQLAKSLDMKVVAEGIETQAQADLLIRLGCDTLQGYFFYKPSPIENWTEDNNQKAKALRMVY